MDSTIKLYSQRAIAIATYFGGPIAAGILIRKNCINFGQERQGLNALIIGLISTILIFIGIFQIPEHIIEKIPNAVIPFIYTGIIYLIVEKIQGADLKKYKEINDAFYSIWRAVGIGALCSVLIISSIFGLIYFESSNINWDNEKYNLEISYYTTNEEVALQLYGMLDNNTKEEISFFINNIGIPKWKDNIKIIDDLNNIEKLPDDFKKQNLLLHEYCTLRIETYELINKATLNESSEYDREILQRHERIDEIINEL